MENSRRIKIEDIEAAKASLDKILLKVLLMRGSLTRNQIIQEIFSSHGFLPKNEKVDELLISFGQEGLIEKKKENGLVSSYNLTQKGQKLFIVQEERRKF